MPVFAAIDADTNGAIAIMDFDRKLADVYHLPKTSVLVKSKGISRERLSDSALADMYIQLANLNPAITHLFIEEQRAFGNDGAPHAFTHGTTYGCLKQGARTAFMALGKELDIDFIPPATWKAAYKLTAPELTYKQKKKKAVDFASQVFPNHAKLWASKQVDTSLAEAMLLCLYGAHMKGFKVLPGDALTIPLTPFLNLTK